jgi:hypothetical protein
MPSLGPAVMWPVLFSPASKVAHLRSVAVLGTHCDRGREPFAEKQCGRLKMAMSFDAVGVLPKWTRRIIFERQLV